jgi:hypothetical protein
MSEGGVELVRKDLERVIEFGVAPRFSRGFGFHEKSSLSFFLSSFLQNCWRDGWGIYHQLCHRLGQGVCYGEQLVSVGTGHGTFNSLWYRNLLGGPPPGCNGFILV